MLFLGPPETFSSAELSMRSKRTLTSLAFSGSLAPTLTETLLSSRPMMRKSPERKWRLSWLPEGKSTKKGWSRRLVTSILLDWPWARGAHKTARPSKWMALCTGTLLVMLNIETKTRCEMFLNSREYSGLSRKKRGVSFGNPKIAGATPPLEFRSPGDGRDEEEAVAFFERAGFAAEEADVFFIEVDIEELADLPLIVADVAPEVGEAGCQLVEGFGDRGRATV